MDTSLSRRKFVCGLSVATATAIATLGSARPAFANEPQIDETNAASWAPESVDETVDCDVCVLGVGSSGLTACVQAAQNGLKVVGIEATGATGGGAVGIEGIFAVDSGMQKEMGIEVHSGKVVDEELSSSQYRAAGPNYLDMLRASGGNIDWLQEQGVSFENVSEYGEIGVNSDFMGFHWFEGGRGNTGFVPAMNSKAEELGVDIRLNTTGEALIMADGKVAGMYCMDADGKYIQVNAPVVILADGGFSNNRDLLAERGFDPDQIELIGVPTSLGKGLQMAIAAGAKNTLPESAFACTNTVGTLNPMGNLAFKICFGGSFLWINENTERYVSENLASHNMEIQCQPALNWENTYMVFDQAIFDAATGGDAELADTWAEQVEQNTNGDIFKADTLEELPEKLGLDKDAFMATVQRYNDLCDEGDDRDYGKDAELMVKIENGPFYLCRFHYALLVTMGGVLTDRKFRVLKADKTPVPGLYAAGVTGAALWRNVYTINVGGGCNANNINSGRVAANDAAEYLQA